MKALLLQYCDEAERTFDTLVQAPASVCGDLRCSKIALSFVEVIPAIELPLAGASAWVK